jgi:hypothetical protein
VLVILAIAAKVPTTCFIVCFIAYFIVCFIACFTALVLDVTSASVTN